MEIVESNKWYSHDGNEIKHSRDFLVVGKFFGSSRVDVNSEGKYEFNMSTFSDSGEKEEFKRFVVQIIEKMFSLL